MKMHYEEDCVGRLAIPDDVLYGVHSARAKGNFPFADKTHPLIVRNLVQLKKDAAIVNRDGGTLAADKARAIVAACNELLLGRHAEAFIVPAIQGGAGTSSNMNVNEVIAHLATRNTGITIHPNDDVNQGQSTNDMYPTAGKMALLNALPQLLESIALLSQTLMRKADEYADAVRVGRTQLQDAVPTTFGRTFHAYGSMFRRDLRRVRAAGDALREVNLGGTAIGTGLNASAYYRQQIVPAVNAQTGLNLRLAADLSDATQNADVYVAFSGAIKALAVNLNKMCNDLRLLGSGPQAGLGELQLPARQAGSSIMPGKVNPVIPEAVSQVAFAAIGNDVAVTMAAEAGQLELNAFEPLVFAKLMANEEDLATAMTMLVEKCLRDVVVNVEDCQEAVEQSAVAATVLVPLLGYNETTTLIKEAIATKQSVRKLILTRGLLPEATVKALFSAEVLTGKTELAPVVQAAGR